MTEEDKPICVLCELEIGKCKCFVDEPNPEFAALFSSVLKFMKAEKERKPESIKVVAGTLEIKNGKIYLGPSKVTRGSKKKKKKEIK